MRGIESIMEPFVFSVIIIIILIEIHQRETNWKLIVKRIIADANKQIKKTRR